ncbi:hypothetical protein BaRGS_00020984 [Batillaria attramentaria]|uniref:G-protein coupled receptors family 1 profile domain-containing protein n=1 Tax=Batillaria attramentaria TaxID=370345 RepID=A0ABD0KL01_9CAEN
MSNPAIESSTTEPEMASRTDMPSTGMFVVQNSTVGNVPEGCVEVYMSNVSSQYPDDLVSQKAYLTLSAIFSGVVVPVFFLIGFSTNFVNMIVFYKHGLRERFNLCVFVLAFTDTIHMCGIFLTYVQSPNSLIVKALTSPETTTLGPVMRAVLDYKLLGLSGFYSASQLISAIVAFERCYCVVRPLKSHTVLSTKTMAGIIVIVCVPAVAGYFVSTSRWNLGCIIDSATGSITFVPKASRFYLQNRQLVDAVNSIMQGFPLPAFCITIVTVMTIITVVKLKQMTRWREDTSTAGRLSTKEVTLTRMLVGTSILFMVCSTPQIVVFITGLFVPGLKLGGYYHHTYSVGVKIYETAALINSSFNFFVYYKFGTKFRETVDKMFLCGNKSSGNKLEHTHTRMSGFSNGPSVWG